MIKDPMEEDPSLAYSKKKMLNYGSLIYLAYQEENGEIFYACAEGFTKQKIRLRVLEQMAQENYSTGLFKIYPSFYNTEYLKTKKRYDNSKNPKSFMDLTNFEKRDLRSELPKQLKTMDEECALNYEQYEKLKGTPIRYGQAIQLMHYNSHKFLVYDLNHVSDYETDNLKTSLKTEYSEESCFRIMPCFSYQQESQGYIYDDDVVHIVSMLDHSRKLINEPFLHASKSKEVEKEIKGKLKKIQKKELNISTEKKSPWKVQIFSDYIDEKKGYLQICDIIWINFSEEELNLIVQKNTEDKSANSCYFKFVKIENTEKYSKFIGNSNGMFMIESEDMRNGGLVRWDQSYRLRHLTSNRYLTLGDTPSWETEEIETEEVTKVLKLVEEYDDASLFRFDCIFSTLSSKNLKNLAIYLQKDSYFRLSAVSNKREYWLKTEEISSEALLNKDQETDTLIVPIFSTLKKQENIFKLAKSSQNETKTTSFLISCMKTIVNTFDYLSPEFLEKNLEKFHSKYKSFIIRIGRLEKCLYDLTQFCHNKLLSFLNPDQTFGSLNPLIQNTLREQSFIEVLVKLLIISFPKVAYLQELRTLAKAKLHDGRKNALIQAYSMQKNEKEIHEALKEEFLLKKKGLCSSVFKLLKSICLSNNSNKIRTAKYLPIFSMQSFYIPNALDCIISIIENYESLLLNIHNEINDDKEDANMLTASVYSPEKRNSPLKLRSTSPSKILRESKLKITEIRAFINDNEEVDFIKENHKKNQTYIELYDSLVEGWQEQEDIIKRTQWDLLNFFIMMIFQAELSLNDKRNLLRFLKTAVVLNGNGVNVNQELIFKYFNLTSNKSCAIIFRKLLFGLQTINKTIMITTDNANSKLEDAFSNNNNFLNSSPLEKEKNLLQLIPQISLQSPKIQKKTNKNSSGYQQSKYLCDQFDFYSMMCNSRNHTWKKFLEEKIKMDAMIQYLDMDLDFEVKSKICKLLMKLYIDQEPRRTQILPELCKVVHVSGNEAHDIDEKNEFTLNQEEQTILSRITTTINSFIESMKNESINIINKHNTFCGSKDNFDIRDKTKEQLMEYEESLKTATLNIFNDFSLEILKLFQLLLRFGVYRISINSKENQELFINLKNLVMILEFDKTYPEARAFLDKRKEKAKESALNPKKLMENIFGAVANTKLLNVFDIFGAMKSDNDKKKIKKKAQINEISNEQLGLTESFLRQNEILKQILNKMLSDIRDDIEYGIKLEICDIIEYYLDYKQDIMLSNLKNSFKQLVLSTQLYEKFIGNELDLDELEKIFTKFIENNIFLILPEIMKTGTSIDDLDPKFKSKEKSNKDIEGLNLNNILEYEILPSLISLFCLTQNYEMENKSLHIMSRLYNQRAEFAKLTSSLLILFDDLNIEIFKMCKVQTKNLARNIDESEKWMGNLTVKENERILEDTCKILHLLNAVLFSESTILNENTKEIHIPANAAIDPIRQDILKHLKAYQIAINLIKDSIYLIENDEEGEKLRDLFKICFLFLKNFVRNNHVNQNLLSENLTVFLVNMESDLGQVELFCEIFRNNKKICLEKNVEIIESMINIIKVNGRQARYLDFFEIIQQINYEEYLLVNQKNVLNLFFDPKNKQHLLYMKEAGNKKYIFDFDEKLNGLNPNYKDEAYLYHAKLIDVLAMTAVGKEGLYTNEIKLRSQINLKYALDILILDDNLTVKKNTKQPIKLGNLLGKEKKVVKTENTEGLTHLKIPLLKFIYFIFLESEKISDEFNKYINEFIAFIEKETERLESFQETTPPYIEYLFDHLLKVFLAYISIFWNDTAIDQKGEINTANSYSCLDKFAKVLEDKIKYFTLDKNIYIKNVTKFFEYFEDVKKESIPLYLEIDEENNIDRKRMTIYQKPRNQSSKDEVWKFLWKNFINIFLSSEILQTEIQTEQMIFAKALWKSDEIFQKKPILRELVNSNEIMRKLINFLQRNFHSPEDKETFIMTLQCLCNYIKITETDLDFDLDQEEKQEKMREEMVQHQNFINQQGAVIMLFTRLSDYTQDKNSEEIFLPLINFGIQLLDEGNLEVQKSIYYYFQNFPSSEMFFLRIHEKINNEILKLKKGDDEDEDDEEDSFAPEKEDPIQSILRFLQLFAEGHNLELQNYLRYQENNYHTYDLIQDIIELLNNYLIKKKEKYFNNMIQCFDTLTEYIQGPCYENQVALIQGSFLDLASNLLAIDEIKEEILTKKNLLKSQTDVLSIAPSKNVKSEKIPRWMVARLKYKCSITLISLLEARKDNDIILRMFKSLHIDILKRNIIDNYIMFDQMYNGKYTKECFLHFKKEPKDEESQKYCSFIIETGFNLFILYSNFIEAKPANIEQENVNVEITQDKGLFQIDLVNQIGKLGLNILKDVTSTVTKHAKNMKGLMGKKNKEQIIKDLEAEIDNNRTVSVNKAMEFFQKNTVHIEVLREDKNIEKAYFYIPPFCHSLKDDEMTKNKFHIDVKRISVKAKVTFLLKKSDELIKVIKHEYYLRELFEKIKITILANNISIFRQVAFILAIVINILVLISYKYETNLPNAEPVNPDTEHQIIGLGVAVIFMSSIIVLYFLIKTAPLLIEKAWVGVKKDKLNIFSYILRLIKTFIYLLSDFYVLYYIIYGLTAIVGTAWTPFFFAFHLFDVIVRYPVLLNVVKAVWIPRKSLALTLFLFIVLMYVFTLFGFYWLDQQYPGGYCDSMFVCLITAWDKSFKNDGGLGQFLNPVDPTDPSKTNIFVLKFFFDNIFNIIIMVIMLNCILGIIIDNFGILREELKAYIYDKENFCFICGTSKETLEKSSDVAHQGFLHHIKYDHNMWNYLFYIAYVREKEPTEYTGIESYVADQLARNEIQWFPYYRALCLKDDSVEVEKQKTKETLERIKNDQENLKNMIKEINQQLDNIEINISRNTLKKTSMKSFERM